MSAPQTALLLVGSPKASHSTSESLGTYLLEELETRGLQTQTVHATRAVRSDDAVEGLIAAVEAADVVILSFPLYIDCLPAPAIRALELIAAHRAGGVPSRDPSPMLVAMAQCGFPEAEHNAVALEICREFAGAAGFVWGGGLLMGAGGMLGGRPLREARGMMRSAVRALDLAAEELAAGRPMPDEATRLFAKPAFPAFAYRLIANRQWRAELKKQGSTEPLDARPFAP